MDMILSLPLIVMLAFTIAACGLIMGAIIAPCCLATRKRFAICSNIIGFIIFVRVLVCFSYFIDPHQRELTQRAWLTATTAMELAGVFVATETVVFLLRWGWNKWRGKKQSQHA